MRRILLGMTGSVATVLYEKLIAELQTIGVVDVILTEKAEHFVEMSKLCDALDKGPGNGFLYTEYNEWVWKREGHLVNKWKKNDPVLHINLRDNSSALVIAPCSVNTLAKLANGICDNLLTSIARAWDRRRPFVIAPAANTHMWEHPVTDKHIARFRGFSSHNNRVVPPQDKMLACGTKGMGAMANVNEIAGIVKEMLRWKFPLTTDYIGIQRCPGIPATSHPGSFGVKRKKSVHTGLDLYADVDSVVVPVEDGIVVGIEPFTGPKDGSPWWQDTECVLVEGASGVVCYGEIESTVCKGQPVFRGNTCIGRVRAVIPSDPKRQHPEIDGWKPSMLHIELYPHGRYTPSTGFEENVDILQDPTQYLIDAEGAPKNMLNPTPCLHKNI